MTEITANYDEPWKEAISDYFPEFLTFFFPKVYHLIDWTKKPISLEQQLQKITADSQDTKRFVDKLFKVWLKDNQIIWILIHIEVQSQKDYDFAQRMYIYNYRAFDLHLKPVISLAILGDEFPSWRPNFYGYNLGDCTVKLEFPTVKLLDYSNQWQELESSTNPFAMMIMAHLKTKATTSNLTEREQWKWLLIRSLYDKNYSKIQIVKLFKFIDSMMTLSEQLQQSLNEKIDKYEEGKTMPLISPYERMAEERGIEKGIKQERINLIMRLLNRKCGQISPELETKITSLSSATLENLAEELLDFNSVNDLIIWLDNNE